MDCRAKQLRKGAPIQRYIGLDVHAASTTFAVVGESGKRLGAHLVETNGQALVEQLKAIAGKRHVVLEEGTQSRWLYEILSPHAEEIVVAMVSESRGQKSDESDAFHLAEQLRTGALKQRVFKEVGEYKRLGELGRTHAMIVQDVVRVQNRIKALLRSRGVAVEGKSVYSDKGREEFLKQLPDASRGAATMLYAQYDAVEAIRRRAEKDLVAEAHRHAMSRVLESCPGLGPIRVAQLMPIVVSPARFRTKRQFWSYCGLGIVMRSTSDWARKPDGGWVRVEVQKTRGLNLNHNHTLKHVFKGAATTVITQLATEPLHQDYQQLITAGTKPNLAKLTLARKIAAIALSMWKSKEKYDPTKHRKQG
ncbi:transposase [Sorangium sp. So ce134]